MANNEKFGWEDEIQNDGEEFITLEEGDYNFVITEFERGQYAGGSKIPACNMAKLTLQVKTDAGTANVKTNLLLVKSLEWKLSSFFRSIGMKKHGEKLVMKWNEIIGKHGRAHFAPRVYFTDTGEERKANDCKRFIDYDPSFFEEADKWEEMSDDIPF